MATMTIDCYTTADDSTGVVWLQADVLKAACILAFQILHFVDKFLAATTAASIFAELFLYVEGDDLLIDMTTQLPAFQQCDPVRSHLVVYKTYLLKKEKLKELFQELYSKVSAIVKSFAVLLAYRSNPRRTKMAPQIGRAAFPNLTFPEWQHSVTEH
ncbi:hypothetical protein TNCV_279061 [Trichonephila clavipes]|nr:hypothetical protein TNCV_279061 [Trichonephila clavipes]